MIVVRVELHSAITGRVTEIARMHITNDGTGTGARGSYGGICWRGRGVAMLNRYTVLRRGEVASYPRKSLHVWNLVSRMLASMGYG